jgi:hypothetical protein
MTFRRTWAFAFLSTAGLVLGLLVTVSASGSAAAGQSSIATSPATTKAIPSRGCSFGHGRALPGPQVPRTP